MLRTLVLAFFAIAVASAPVQRAPLQPPVPSLVKVSNKHQDKGAASAQSASKNGQIALPSPIVVKLLNPPDDHGVADELKRYRQQSAADNQGQWIFNILLVLVGFGQIGVLIYTGLVTNKAANAARDAASAVPIAERAYVFTGPLKVENTGAPDERNAGTRVFLSTQNFGKTPAIINAIHAEVASELPESAIYTKDPKWHEDFVLGAGERHPSPNKPDESGLYFWSNSPTVQYFFGYVRYTDVFKKPRISRFCVQLHPQLNAFTGIHNRPDLTGFD